MGIQDHIWRVEDQKALEIYALLRQSYKRLAQDVGYFSNVFGIFFHYLMIYSTNYILIKAAKEQYDDPVDIPFLNSVYTTSPYQLEIEEKPILHSVSKKAKLLQGVSSCLGGSINVSYIGVIEATILQIFIRAMGRMKLTQETNALCFLRDADMQIAALETVLYQVAKIADVARTAIFVNNFLSYVLSWLRPTPPNGLADYLIIGTNLNVVHRIVSANYLDQGKQVISIFHGEQCVLTHDDPVMGYGELSFCNALISYGSTQLPIGEYNKPLQQKPEIIQRSSLIIQDYYKTKHIPYVPLTKKEKILYIPTQFSGRNRYGPFRDIDTNQYKAWQEVLLNLDLDISYKPHPKSKVTPDVLAAKTVTGWLQDCILDYNFYFLDFISTASALAVATDKPIIYFNLGLMNLSDQAFKDFKQRVFWVNIDLNGDLKDQVIRAIAAYNEYKRDFVNEYTEKYSINRQSQVQTADIIWQWIQGKSFST